jgi:hypothetical protein
MSLGHKTINCPPTLSQADLDTKTRATAQAWGNKRHSYKPLPTRFQRDGFDYRQIAREGDCAIYEQRWSGCRNPSPAAR